MPAPPVAKNQTAPTVSARQGLSATQIAFVATGLTGSFTVNITAQFLTSNLADVQGRIGASADEVSWLTTTYTAANLAGIILAGPMIRAFGLRRFMAACALIFGVSGAAALALPSLVPMIVLRALQGIAAGGLGPVAFIAVFMVMSGKRLPLGLTILSFVLLLPGTMGPVLAAVLEDRFGWRIFYWSQVLVGVSLIPLALSFLPRQPLALANLKTDWVAIALLSTALSAAVVFLSQGTRRFWFENDLIFTSATLAASAATGFVILTMLSPNPIVVPGLIATRRFGPAILLNLIFRGGLAVTGYLVPQYLALVQGYRPLEVAQVMVFAVLFQLLAMPIVWELLHRIDTRIVLAVGLLLCAMGTAFGFFGSSYTSGDQLLLLVIIFAFGQAMFLVADILIGAGALKPTDLPTASIAFNATTLGGTALGVGLVSDFVTEREKFHSNVLTENLRLYDPQVADRVSAIASSLASRFSDDASATAQAVQLLSSAARKQAWTLAFNDGYLVVACILAASAALILIIPKSPAPGRK